MPTTESVYQQAEEWMKLIRHSNESILRSVIVFNSEPLFCQLTQSVPVLLIVCDTTTAVLPKIIHDINFRPSKKLTTLLLTTDEALSLASVHPLELLHIKSGYNVLYGDDIIVAQEINSVALSQEVVTEMLSTLWHMRSNTLTIHKGNLCATLQGVLRKLYPALKGALYLKGDAVPAQEYRGRGDRQAIAEGWHKRGGQLQGCMPRTVTCRVRRKTRDR